MKTKLADVRAVRGVNRAAVINLIRDHAPISKPQIASRLGISPATVQRIVEDLIREDLVCRQKGNQGLVGRPSELLYFNGEAYTVAGVDLGFPNMQGMLSSFSGDIKYEHNIGFERNAGEVNYSKLCEMIDVLLNKSIQLHEPIKAVGLGIPGIIDRERGFVNSSPDLGWENFAVVERLRAEFSVPVFVERDINLIALGEHGFGVGRGSSNLICFTIGTYMKAAMIIGGELYRGHFFRAGQLGNMLPGVDSLAYRNDLHRLGGLAEFASGTHVLRRAKEALRAQGQLQRAETITPMEVYDAARQGEDWAQPIIQDVIRYVAWAVANLTVLFDPEMIIISGKISGAADFIVEPILEVIDQSIPWKPKLLISNLGARSTVLGAVRMIYQMSFSF